MQIRTLISRKNAVNALYSLLFLFVWYFCFINMIASFVACEVLFGLFLLILVLKLDYVIVNELGIEAERVDLGVVLSLSFIAFNLIFPIVIWFMSHSTAVNVIRTLGFWF